MQTILIAIHLMVVVALVAVVLLQRSEGGALGVGGGSGFMTGRGQANILTRATAILATLFFITSLGLTLLANYSQSNKSVLEGIVPAAGTPSVPGSVPQAQGSVLDQLRKLEDQRAKSGGAASGEGAQVPSKVPEGGIPPSANSPSTKLPSTKPPRPTAGAATTPSLAAPPAPANATPVPKAAPVEPTGIPSEPAGNAPSAPVQSAPAPAAPK